MPAIGSEIAEPEYEYMLDVLPPMFFRPGVFAVSEFKGGKVASVFVTLTIAGRHRWFLGFCDLEIAQSPEMLRDAILVRETAEHPDRLSREEKIEIIWNATPSDLRGYAGASDTGFWPPQDRGKRTILVNGDGLGTIPSLLEDLTDAQIADMLPADLTRIDADDQGDGHV
uniref:DUF1419 domain-containing protein n=1 Tax=Rhizobium sp. RCAM05350 TaxID=2895568 RepID=UPI0020769DFC|nr:DUF1419 domain-containing protein [Rhizobium sp. RCAM05350]